MAAKLGILGSGAGSNMAAIVDACQSGLLVAEPVLVLCDVENAGILELAKERQITGRFIPPGPFKSKLSDDMERRYIEALQEADVNWVLLAGFMRIIKSEFLRAFPERIVNIHPSLLPSFPGLNAPAQAISYGVQVTGTTVHWSTKASILAQSSPRSPSPSHRRTLQNPSMSESRQPNIDSTRRPSPTCSPERSKFVGAKSSAINPKDTLFPSLNKKHE